uniref:uncharacterized protein LOC113475297 n=1 Tax=Ciona intestinalis TaxID=7719 RepID=UPI000EF55808|nr:uncharacterized protein LOC113475297 [Ciona intestinalis]|eukprot:XP_026695123.1 uncharacterized protein LOC113475297 [Ciona intestinalis]
MKSANKKSSLTFPTLVLPEHKEKPPPLTPLTPEPSSSTDVAPAAPGEKEFPPTPLTDSIARTCEEYFALLRMVSERAKLDDVIQEEPALFDNNQPEVPQPAKPLLQTQDEQTALSRTNQHQRPPDTQTSSKTIRLHDNSTQFETKYVPNDVTVTSEPRVMLPSWWLRQNNNRQTETTGLLRHTTEVAVNTLPEVVDQSEQTGNNVIAVAKTTVDKRRKSRDSRTKLKSKEVIKAKPCLTSSLTSSMESEYASSSSSDRHTFITESKKKIRSRCAHCRMNDFDKQPARWIGNQQIPFCGPIVTSSMGNDVSVQYPSNVNLLKAPELKKCEKCEVKKAEPLSVGVGVQATGADVAGSEKVDKSTSFDGNCGLERRSTVAEEKSLLNVAGHVSEAPQDPKESIATAGITPEITGNILKGEILSQEIKKESPKVKKENTETNKKLSKSPILESRPKTRVFKIELCDVLEKTLEKFAPFRDARPLSSRRIRGMPTMMYGCPNVSRSNSHASTEATTTSNSCVFDEVERNFYSRKMAAMSRVESDMLADNIFYREQMGKSPGIRLNKQRRFYVPAHLIEEREHTPNVQTFPTPRTGKSTAPSLMLGTEISDFIQTGSGLSGDFVTRWRRGTKSGERREMMSQYKARDLTQMELPPEKELNYRIINSREFWNELEERRQTFDCDVTISKNERPTTATMTSQINLPKIDPNNNEDFYRGNHSSYNVTRDLVTSPFQVEVVNKCTTPRMASVTPPKERVKTPNNLPRMASYQEEATTAPMAGVREIQFPKMSLFLKREIRPADPWELPNATDHSMEHLAPSSGYRINFFDSSKARAQQAGKNKELNAVTTQARKVSTTDNDFDSTEALASENNNDKPKNRPRLIAKRKL